MSKLPKETLERIERTAKEYGATEFPDWDDDERFLCFEAHKAGAIAEAERAMEEMAAKDKLMFRTEQILLATGKELAEFRKALEQILKKVPDDWPEIHNGWKLMERYRSGGEK